MCWCRVGNPVKAGKLKKKECDYMKIKQNIVEQDDFKNTLPPIKREVHLLLREYCLRKTRESGKLTTQGAVVEKAILDLIDKDNKKK